jgi:SAM-dependent methyltransferase
MLTRHGRLVGLDVSRAMLAAARAELGAKTPLLLGSVEELPFRDDSFDAVVCCRLLHHFAERDSLARALAELVRVSRDLVVASFWDAHSLPALRRAFLPGRRVPRRIARTRADLAAAVAAAGADVVGWKHSLRFVSRQTFLVARKRPRA